MQFKLLFILLMGSSFYIPALAQDVESERFTLLLRDVSLEDALEQLVVTTKMNLMYDPAIISNVHVFCNSRNQPPANILKCITNAADLDYYQLSSGTYVLIEKAQEEPQYGSLAGIVIDGETGEPLPFANVFLADASTGTATNSAGMFTFTSLLKGPHAVVATYVGYEPALDSVWIPADGNIRKQIVLNPAPITSDPIIVNGMQQRLPSIDLGSGNLEPAQFSRSGFQGTGDVLFNASSVMAVGIRSPYVDLHIQGGESSEHQVLLDGVPVFEPVSLGRLMGAFSPLAIGRLSVQKAGFGVMWGSQLAGIISAHQNIEAKNQRRLTVHLDPLSVNAKVNVGLNLPGKATGKFMVAGRTSVWDYYRFNALNNMLKDWNADDPQLTATSLGIRANTLQFTPHRHGSDVGFSDLHLAGEITINPFQKLYISAYQGKNNVSTQLLTAASADVLESDIVLLSRDKYRWTNATALVKHEWLLGARTMGIISLSNSLHTLRHNYSNANSQSANLEKNLAVPEIENALVRVLDESRLPDDENMVRETTISARLEYSLSKNHHLLAGLEVTEVENRFNLASPYYVPILLDHVAWRTTGYLQDNVSMGLATVVELGTRYTYIPGQNNVYFEPRIALRHDVSRSVIGAYALHLAAGVYRQYINQFNLSNVGPSAAVPSIRFWLPVDKSLSPPLAFHYSANFLLMPATHWHFRIESYYKHQPHILALNYHPLLISGVIDTTKPLTEDEFIETSNGYALGGGIFVEHRYERGLIGLNYSYSQSKRRYPGRFNNRLETTPWNEPHRLSLTHDVSITQQLSASLRAHGIWGRSWGFRQAYYDYLAAHNPDGDQFRPYDLTHPSAHKMTPYYQVDAGLAFDKEFTFASIQLRADVLNVLDRRNVVDWSFVNPADPAQPLDRIERTMPGIMTAISLRAQF